MRFLLSSLLAIPIVLVSFVIMVSLINSEGFHGRSVIYCFPGMQLDPSYFDENQASTNASKCMDCGSSYRRLPPFIPGHYTPSTSRLGSHIEPIISLNELKGELIFSSKIH